MRAGRDNGFLSDKHGAVFAVNLGADFCAEHEWGIEGIRRELGMDDIGYGIERRRVRKFPSCLHWITWAYPVPGTHTKLKSAGFCMNPYEKEQSRVADYMAHEAYFYGGRTLWTGWSGETFGAVSTNEKQTKALREIFDAMQRLDACVWVGGGGVFQNAGLIIGITSRMDPEVLAKWEKYDRDNEQLKADALMTGIEGRLRNAGKQFYALSPSRVKGELKFWLNPMDQDRNNAGWFTVKDLDDWIAGKGPVPMKRPERRAR